MRQDQPARDKAARKLAENFYRAMPGADPVPSDASGRRLWGEVDGSEHFHFCQCIATAIIAVSSAVFVDPD